MKFLRFFLAAALCSLAAGCIRLSGTAGVWHKDAETGETKSKSVTADTDKLIHPNRTPGDITL